MGGCFLCKPCFCVTMHPGRRALGLRPRPWTSRSVLFSLDPRPSRESPCSLPDIAAPLEPASQDGQPGPLAGGKSAGPTREAFHLYCVRRSGQTTL